MGEVYILQLYGAYGNLNCMGEDLLYFLEISPQQDFISSPHLVRRQFEGGKISRVACAEIDARAYTASDQCLFVCTYNAHAHVYIVVELLPYSEISKVAFIGTSEQEHAVTFRGQWDFEVQ